MTYQTKTPAVVVHGRGLEISSKCEAEITDTLHEDQESSHVASGTSHYRKFSRQAAEAAFVGVGSSRSLNWSTPGLELDGRTNRIPTEHRAPLAELDAQNLAADPAEQKRRTRELALAIASSWRAE